MALLKYLLIALLLIILNASAIIAVELEDDNKAETSSPGKLRLRRQDEGGLDDESKAVSCYKTLPVIVQCAIVHLYSCAVAQL